MRVFRIVAVGFAALVSAGMTHAAPAPAFTDDGRLIPPADYREWIFLSSGLDMSYLASSPGMEMPSLFGNVFVNPEAYRAFMRTGTWPNGTIFAAEHRIASSKGSINRSGKFQTDIAAIEFHVKAEVRGKSQWMFFGGEGQGPLEKIPETASCYSCHQQHAAVDTTFVQFYPTLLPVAKAHGTLSAAFVKEEAAAAPH